MALPWAEEAQCIFRKELEARWFGRTLGHQKGNQKKKRPGGKKAQSLTWMGVKQPQEI